MVIAFILFWFWLAGALIAWDDAKGFSVTLKTRDYVRIAFWFILEPGKIIYHWLGENLK